MARHALQGVLCALLLVGPLLAAQPAMNVRAGL